MTSHDPFTGGTAVTILPGVPLDGVPAQRTESPATETLASPAAAVPAASFPQPAPVAQPIAPAPATAFPQPAPVAQPAAAFPQPAAAFPQPIAPTPAAAAVPPPAAAIRPVGPAYVPQAQTFPTATVFDAEIPAAPAAFPTDVPAAPVAAQSPAPPFTPTPAPAFPPADAVTTIPAQQVPVSGTTFQPVQEQLVPLPQAQVVPDDNESKPGKRRKEGSSGVSPVKVAAIGAAVIGLAAGWFGHGALSGSNSDNGTSAPIITHAPVSRAVPLASVAAIGSMHVLPKPWVTTAQQALLSSNVVSSTTPVYFGAGGSYGTYAELGVSVGKLSTAVATRGSSYPAGPGGGTVRCGVSATGVVATSWCTWKDAKSSGMVARFATRTVTDAYSWTQLVRQTLEP